MRQSSRLIAILVAGSLAVLPQLLRAQKAEIGHEITNHLRAGEFGQARDLAEQALRSSPRDARLWTLKGLALVQLGKEADAFTCFSRALQIAPTYIPALESAAQLKYQVDPLLAAPFLQRILHINPDDQASHAMLSQIALQAGDCEAARRESALSQPGMPETAGLQQFGWCLLKQKRTVEAIPIFERLRAAQPEGPALYHLAVAQFLAGRFTDVIKTLEPELDKNTATPDMLEVLAEAYDFTADPARAINMLKDAIRARPEEPDYYTDFAYMCQAHGQFQEGLAMLDAGLQKLPRAASLYVARGVLQSELGNWEKGEADFQRANELDPNVELGSAAQGLAELQQNDLTKAERTTRERLGQHPNDAFLYYLLAEVLTRKGMTPGSSDFEQALAASKRSIELKPELLLARNVLARLYLENGEFQKSVEQSRAVYMADPTDQTALYHLILALRKSGSSSELPDLLKRLAELKERSHVREGLQRKAAETLAR